MSAWFEGWARGLPLGHLDPGALVAAGAGLMYCFVGYRLLRLVLGLTGFALAGLFAAGLAAFLCKAALAPTVLAGILGGMAGAFAMFRLYKLGVFLVGLLGAGLVAQAVLSARPEPWAASAVVGAAVFGGLCAFVFERPIMMLATAVIGAWAAVLAARVLWMGGAMDPLQALRPDATAASVLFLCWLVLAAAGSGFQFRMSAPAKR